MRLIGLLIGLIAIFCGAAQAQTPLPDWLSVDERQRIEHERGDKEHAEILLKISQVHLNTAHDNLNSQQYEQASNEIKNYGALIDCMIDFINRSTRKEGDKKKIFKIVELNLRRDLNLLESMRYDLPEKYADEANQVYDRVRKAREDALGAVFGKDFFPVGEPTPEKNSLQNSTKEK
jgi:hypothetical protein